MGDWIETTLGDQITLQRGFDITAKDFVDGGIPVISSGGISGYHIESKAKGPGVITGRKGTLGSVYYIDTDYWPHDTTLWVKDFKGNLPRFVYYFLKAIDFKNFDVGSSNPTLNRNHVHPLKIRWPVNFSEQKRIAEILGALDDKIELNRRMNRTLEAMARALFQSWFVDFDPVHAKARGETPYGMDEATAFLFPDSFENTAVGRVPRGWGVQALPDAFEVNPTRRLAKNTVAPYVEMANMPTTSARISDWVNREVGSGARFVNGDTLVARITPCLENGKTAFVDFLEDGEIAWGSTEYIVFRPKLPLPLEYAYLLARTDDFRTHAIRNMSGTSGRQRVPVECFNTYMVVVPDVSIGIAFSEVVSSLFEGMKRNDEESKNLAILRDTLLPKLVSGEVGVVQLEAMVE